MDTDSASAPGTQVVWLKRDLRLHDHWPLCEAAQRGPILVFYGYEDEWLESEECDPSHQVFIDQCLAEVQEGLRRLGARFLLRRGRFPDLFEDLWQEHPFRALWSHEETSGHLGYQRDLRVADWAKSRGVVWNEIPQHGVVRRLASRDGWAALWEKRMRGQQAPQLTHLPHPQRPRVASRDEQRLSLRDLGLPESQKVDALTGGETQAFALLDSFFVERGLNYRADMSSPVEAWDGCSRISPYLTWGALSLRTTFQRTLEQSQHLKAQKAEGESVDRRWFASLKSFDSRLRWHCHFMQKLEDEPDIEFRNMNRHFDGLREDEFDEEKFAAWCAGETGYPMVDACMKALQRTGWINFRMRAMLVSFAANHLWLHWRRPAVYLARHFLDFEPGIHFSQFQMQSGTTGINTIRIYSPRKQVIDQDPRGVFLKQFLPALEGVPEPYLAEPHLMPMMEQQMAGCVIGRDYPEPIVDHGAAYQHAKLRIGEARKAEGARTEAKRVYLKHGSRKEPLTSRRR